MSYAFFYDVPGDEHTYGKVKAEIGEEHPRGLLVQLVSKLETGGLRHLNVWESKEDWDRFQREQVAPAVGKVLASMGITEPAPPPAPRELDLIDVITKG